MPLLTIVTFKDADGDEFPVAIHGIPASDSDAERIGRDRVQSLKAEGRWRPTGKLALVDISYPDVGGDAHAEVTSLDTP